MTFNPDIHHRKSIRLKGYDYSKEGLYFITICTQTREHLFGEIIGGKMILNNLGEIIKKELLKTNEIRENIKIDKWVIMPNHIHFIIEILEGFPSGKPVQNDIPNSNSQNVGCLPLANPNKLKANTVGSIVNQIKSKVTKEIRKETELFGIWQRNYYEHIIRNEEAYIKISEYIKNNPTLWQNDKYYGSM
jgi:REP element-mobilizing transposase RayT